MNANKLSINGGKTKFILFRSKNNKTNVDIQISINNEVIKRVKNIAFLGIVIDKNLTWFDHLDLIIKKIIKCAAIISRICHFTNLINILCIGLFVFNFWKSNLG